MFICLHKYTSSKTCQFKTMVTQQSYLALDTVQKILLNKRYSSSLHTAFQTILNCSLMSVYTISVEHFLNLHLCKKNYNSVFCFRCTHSTQQMGAGAVSEFAFAQAVQKWLRYPPDRLSGAGSATGVKNKQATHCTVYTLYYCYILEFSNLVIITFHCFLCGGLGLHTCMYSV